MCDGRELYVSFPEKAEEHEPLRAAGVSHYSVFQQPFQPCVTPINLPSHVTQNVDKDEWQLTKGQTKAILLKGIGVY